MAGTIEIRTERLLLRKHIPSDAEVLYELAGKDESMYRYSGWNPYETQEMAAETVRRFIASYDDPLFFGWGIEHEGKLIGTIGAYDYDRASKSIEAGFSIFCPYQGHGFASEALKAVIDYLLSRDEIEMVTAWCASENPASARTMENAGMRLKKIVRGDLHVGEKTYDRMVYVCKKEDSE